VKKFELARRALVDLREIWEFASQHSFAVADYLLEELYQQFQKLAEMPGIGHRRPDLTGQDVLFSAVHSYLIIYKGSKPLRSVRIIHAKRDVKRLLKN
jgi:plasmid stabilization system protein ParE